MSCHVPWADEKLKRQAQDILATCRIYIAKTVDEERFPWTAIKMHPDSHCSPPSAVKMGDKIEGAEQVVCLLTKSEEEAYKQVLLFMRVYLKNRRASQSECVS